MVAKSPPDKMFWVVRGDHIDNLKDLANCIASLTNEQFHYHVNDKKNDFAKWIADVFKETKLAKALHHVHDKSQYAKIIHNHLG